MPGKRGHQPRCRCRGRGGEPATVLPGDSSGLEPDQSKPVVQNPGTTLAHPPTGRLPGWFGQYFDQSGGVDACGEAEKSLCQFVGGLHGGVVAHAVE